MGYSVLGPWRGLGVATEGVRAFTKELFREPLLQRITAQTFPHLIPSLGVLTKCGFQVVGADEEQRTIRYELRRTDS
jgi:RimJ/RimL family protein N-acetyltransferase